MLKRIKLKKVIGIIICLLCLAGNTLRAQDITQENRDKLKIMEDSMVVTADSMYNAYIPETHSAYCERFVKQLVRALKIPGSYYYAFDSLKNYVNIIYPDDNAYRIFNWGILTSAVAMRYYGAIQLPDEHLKLYPLIDYTEELGKAAEDSVLTGNKWYGALYYRIITHEVDGNKVYTLFGMNGESPISNKKVLDVLTITPEGAQFGAPIFAVGSFTNPGQRINRFILEYKKGVQASLNWDDERKVIIFDKLVSQVNDPNRKYTYVPSGEYDGFRWDNGQWNYLKDLIPIQNLKDGEAPSGRQTPKE